MNKEQNWGRKESLIWPPRGFIATWSALFLAVVFTGALVYLRYNWGLDPLERYYLPSYIRSNVAFTPIGKFRLVILSRSRNSRFAVPSDVRGGMTPQIAGKPLPFALMDQQVAEGFQLVLARELPYQTKEIREFFARNVYAGQGPFDLFRGQLLCGVLALGLQLPWTLRKDIKRRRELRYGRRLKGPELLTPKQFNDAVKGDGIGIKTLETNQLVRIPLHAENQHLLAIGDTGSGKTSIIRQIAFRVQEREECAVIYDPAGEFIRQFYDEKRGDIVLNPLDARMPYWNPADEVEDEPEALTLAESFYQPDQTQNQFFVDSPQKIFAFLISQHPKPRPEDLVRWMSTKNDIEHKLKNTEHAVLVDATAGPQRAGVLSSLNKISTTLRLLPTVEERPVTEWSARQWAEQRRGWIFLTSTTPTRKAIRPLHCVWLDMLVMRLLSVRRPDQKRVWFLIDELASLQKLPQLHTALTENRKSENPVVLGFQGRSQLEARYGTDAEAMLSQPATKIFLRTDEPRAAKWISDNIGEVEIERMREAHHDGSSKGRNFSLERLREPLVMPSEVQGLANLRAYLKYGNYVAQLSLPYVNLEDRAPDFIRRIRAERVTPVRPRDGRSAKGERQREELPPPDAGLDLAQQVG